MALRAATARTDITPPVGTELAGWCFGASRGIADRLYARALVVDEGDAPVVIVTADLIGLGTEYASRFRSEVARRLRTSPERVVVACSHTHSGPATMPLRRWGTIDPLYVESLIGSMVDAVETAAKRLEPAWLAHEEGEVGGICDNRRGDGGNVVDESLPVLCVNRSDGSPLALLFNYSCHPVAAHNDRNLISADFPGYATGLVDEALPGVQSMFTLGAAGDVNPVEFHRLDLAEEYGRRIGRNVVELAGRELEERPLEGRRPVDERPQLDAVSRVVRLPTAVLPEAEWLREERDRWAAEATRLGETGGPHSKVEDALIKSEWADEALGVVEAGQAASHLEMEIAALRLGAQVLVAMPGELFVEIGISIKNASAFPRTAIVELANGSLSYLPTAEAYRRGGYETDFSAKVYGLYMLTDEAQAIIENTAGELIGELARRFGDQTKGRIHE